MEINLAHRELLRLDRSGVCDKARLVYVASAAASAAAAASAVGAAAPDRVGSAKKRHTEVTASPGGGIYEVTVDYADDDAESDRRREKRAGDRVWKFSVVSDYALRTASLGTVRSIYLQSAESDRIAPGTRLEWNGRTGQESASGSLRVLEPHFCESCRATFRASGLNTAYKRRAAAAVGKVNAAAFHHWEPGEVLLESIIQSETFRNASGSELCDVMFNFAIRPNGPRTCAGQRVDNVEGWDHLWAVTGMIPGGTAETVTALHVSRIYERTSFSVLEI